MAEVSEPDEEAHEAAADQCMICSKAREAGGGTNHFACTRYNISAPRDSYSMPLDGGHRSPQICETGAISAETLVGGS